MDRRRKLFVFFLIVLVVAALDIRANGIEILDEWGRLFEVKSDGVLPGDPTRFTRATATYTQTQSAEDVSTFVLEQGHGPVYVRDGAGDEIELKMEVHALTDVISLAQSYAAGFDVALERVGDEVRATWQAPPDTEHMRLAQMTWHVTVPRGMAVRIDSGPGFVSVWDTGGPVHVRTDGADVDILQTVAVPIDVAVRDGKVKVLLPRDGMNHTVDAAVRFGRIELPAQLELGEGALRRTQEGGVTRATGVLGDGEHPLTLDVTVGQVTLAELQREETDR